MPVCGNYLFFELPKKIVLNPKDGFFNISLILTGYNVHIKAKQARFPQCLSAGHKC